MRRARSRWKRGLSLLRQHYQELRRPHDTVVLALRLGYRLARGAVARLTALGRLRPRHAEQPAPDEVPALAIRISGGIGDYLVCARFLRDLQAGTEPFAFDVFCSRVPAASWVFECIPGFRQAHDELMFEPFARQYTAALWLTQFAVVYEPTVRWAQLARHVRLANALRRIADFRDGIDLIVERHPHMDGVLGAFAVYSNRTRADFLHSMAKLEYGGDGLSLRTDTSAPARFGRVRAPYCTIHNGHDDGMVLATRASTKRYPHWSAVVALLKQSWAGLVVVQIGSGTSTPIEGVDVCLIDQTSLQQAAEIILGAALHLDHESGLVHLARCLGVKSCVVFGPTSADYFGYDGNINLRPRICGGCWWIKPTWMDQCPRGFAEPVCTHSTPAADVVAAVLAVCGPGTPAHIAGVPA